MENKKEIYKPSCDPTMQDTYIDIDETRQRILYDGRSLEYRFVHGGFRQNNVKFIFCFPSKETFRNRFFQYLSPFPGPDEEMASLDKTGADDRIAFALLNGAYFVETNMGASFSFGPIADPTICYKASAAAAEFSRKVASDYYGCSRPYGYVYGGSGGGYKTMACIENTDAFDGAVPYVIGSPVSLPNTITMHAQGQRVLRNAFGKIVDSLDAGGSGNMYDGLSDDEAFILRELTRMGFPPKAWFPEAWGMINDGSLPVLAPVVKAKDPGYFEDFWKEPGYLGSDANSSAAKDRLVFYGKVKSVHSPGTSSEDRGGLNGVDDAWKKMLSDAQGGWIELEEIPHGDDLYLGGVSVRITSGAAAGKQMLLSNLIPSSDGIGGIITIGMSFGMDDLSQVIGSIQPGDTLVLDNSDYIAIQSYYRHQVPFDTAFHAWDQFRDESSNPTLPQRENVMGYGFTGTGTVQDGNIQGKVIVIQALMDESTCPWCGDWYRRKVVESKGSDEDFRIYYMERCMHGDITALECNMITNYVGALQQALLDLSDWVERGIAPLASTVYTVTENQVSVPDAAADRLGIQPTVRLTANGKDCARVKVGEPVTLRADISVPKDAGHVTYVHFSFDEVKQLPLENAFPTEGRFFTNGNDAIAYIDHTYDHEGTYFASVRVQAQRNGDNSTPFTQVRNLARVRIIVEK